MGKKLKKDAVKVEEAQPSLKSQDIMDFLMKGELL